MERVTLILATLLLRAAVGDDLYWIPNTNWDNPSNWGLNRPPCSGEVANLASVPENSVIYLNTNTTVRSIILPRNGKLLLKAAVTITFSEEVTCPGDREPLPGEIPEKNEFVGAKSTYWECPQNWQTKDQLPAKSPPCGKDNAVFEEEATYSFVVSNESVTVRSLTVRGVQLNSLSDLPDASGEFQLSLTINPKCEENPSLCPCLSQGGCPKDQGPSVGPPKETGGGGGGGSDMGGIAAGVVVIVIVVIIIAFLVAVVIGIVVYRKRKLKISYSKDELAEPEDATHTYETATSQEPTKGSLAFENPVWDAGTSDTDNINLVGSEVLETEEERGGGIPGDDFKEDLGKYKRF